MNGKEKGTNRLEMRVNKIIKADLLTQASGITVCPESPKKALTHTEFEQTRIAPSEIFPSESCLSQNKHNVSLAKRKHMFDSDDSCSETTTTSSRKRVAKSKYQNHYEPTAPMTKEEEAKWRLEARKKRNRDSAAASRKKTQSRISELENEVTKWKSKYDLLYQKLNDMEKIMNSVRSPFQPQALEQDVHNKFIPISFQKSNESHSLVSPSDSPISHPIDEIHVIPESFSFGSIKQESSLTSYHNSDVVINQHLNEFVSRPA
jgi:predicted ribosome quality control (RQC) complex YloA/Tae2 family protein